MPSIKELRARFESEKPGSAAANAAFKNWKAAVDAKNEPDEEEVTEPTAPAETEEPPKVRRRRGG